MTVITRFPPSPTGSLHIGSARTALFNWLYAHHHGGKFLLRIEDTDLKRSSQTAVDSIFNGLVWLGLTWDGEAIFQSKNLERHTQVAKRLLEAGMAYKCYCTQDELDMMRTAARQQGKRIFYDRRWRDRGPDEALIGLPHVVRIKMPLEGETTIQDHVQGKVTILNEQLDDFIIVRADGTPTYMLSVVVDDHDAGVTHIIRGDDHLNNAFRQHHLYKAANWRIPEYAHIPLIHGAKGEKLSKRHGATSVQEYQDDGFLPDALRNYLLRLGWSHGDDEFISTKQAIEWFDLDAVRRSPSRFDLTKLESINAHYMRQANPNSIVEAIVERLQKVNDEEVGDMGRQRITKALPQIAQRAKTLVQLTDAALFLVKAPSFPLKEQKAEKILLNGGFEILEGLKDSLADLTFWNAEALEVDLRSRGEELGLGFGKIAQSLRVALCGSTTSPGIFDVLVLLGREDSLARIDRAIANYQG